MKKWMIWLLVLTLTAVTAMAFAAPSIRQPDLQKINIVKVIPVKPVDPENPEDPEAPQPVIEVKVVDPTPEIIKIIEEVKTTYTLTIRYITFDGQTVAPTYSKVLNVGVQYDVPSPEVEGYTTPTKVVQGTMPNRDVEYVVIYYPNPEGDTENPVARIVTMDEYETPLGLEYTIMNAGVAFE